MRIALDDARLQPGQIGYVNAHATSTPQGDSAECGAIRQVFGAHTDHLPVSGTKGATGHLLGAAGAIEAAFCLQALRDGVLPGTRNLESPDPACVAHLLGSEPRETKIEYALSNSFGFGGHCASLIFGRGEH